MTRKHMKWGWFFISPYLVGFTLFTLFALLFSAYVSFTDYNIFNPPKWIGLKNFTQAWNSSDTWTAFRNIFTYTLILETSLIFIGCIFAMALNTKTKGIGVFRVLYFIPVLTPMVAVAFVWSAMYNPSYGILNYLLSYIGLGPFKFTFSTHWFEAVASIAVMNVWKGVGYTTVFLLAGLQNISEDIMEAAEIDGAGSFKKFFRITLPLLTPTIFFLFVIGVISDMQVFDSFYIMKETTGAETVVIGTLIYNNVFVFSKVGLGAAIGWISFGVIAILTGIQKFAEKKWVYYV